jgi:putative FmdB family regulatory protein
MPTYEYACSGCGNAWEEMQKITEAPLEVCPKCHQATAKRQISGGNFILKGGGWYADLYSSSKPKSGDSSSSSSASAPSTAETKKTETKTESAAPATPAPSKSAAE